MKKDVKQFVKDYKKEILIGGGALVVTAIIGKRIYGPLVDLYNFRKVANGCNGRVIISSEELLKYNPDLEYINLKEGGVIHVKSLIGIGDIVV